MVPRVLKPKDQLCKAGTWGRRKITSSALTLPLPLLIVISYRETTSRGEQSLSVSRNEGGGRGGLCLSVPLHIILLSWRSHMQTHPAFICKLGNISYFEAQINAPTPQKRHRLGFLCKQYRVNPPSLRGDQNLALLRACTKIDAYLW